MNYQQFLEALRNTPRTWGITLNRYGSRQIRNAAGWCPMQEVFGDEGWSSFPQSEALRITRAADRIEWSPHYDPQVRQDLLAACDLVEA